ncbi:MAG: hypothetical protein LUE17_14755 [Planctomycetaceae bacterium]|nr:hypothetical protein [Planctomycetaceae bacterium]
MTRQRAEVIMNLGLWDRLPFFRLGRQWLDVFEWYHRDHISEAAEIPGDCQQFLPMMVRDPGARFANNLAGFMFDGLCNDLLFELNFALDVGPVMGVDSTAYLLAVRAAVDNLPNGNP